MGINSKGSFVPDDRIASRRTGAGMKIDEPSKSTRPFSSGAGMFATSWADSQSERSVTAGTTIWQSARAVLKSMRTYVA